MGSSYDDILICIIGFILWFLAPGSVDLCNHLGFSLNVLELNVLMSLMFM